MKDKSQSPQDKTQVRIAKDKRELQRLIKKAEKHLVEGHSPVVYDYVNYALDGVPNYLNEAEKSIDNSIDLTAFNTDGYLTRTELALLESVDIWSREGEQAFRDFDERTSGYIYEKVSDVEKSYDDAALEALDRLNILLDEEGQALREIDASNDEFLQEFVDRFNRFLDDAKVKGGDENIGWMDAIGVLPEIVVGVATMIDGFVNLDPDKFIEDSLEMRKAQKRLQERISTEEI